MEIRFLEPYTVKAEGGASYEAGPVYDLPEGTARHFINNGRAVPADSVIEQPESTPEIPSKESNSANLNDLFAKVRAKKGIVEKPRSSGYKVPKNPFVTAIMPTYNRRDFIGAAIDCWRRQTWHPRKRELIVLDDGEDSIEDLIPDLKSIRYIRLNKKLTTGEKRNRCVKLAKGDVIVHFDDDDWSAPDRIEHQIERLQETGKPITGYSTLLFWDTQAEVAKRYQSQVLNYVCGTSLCYLKDWALDHPFPDKDSGEDNGVVYRSLDQIAASHDVRHIVCRIHGAHTSPKDRIAKEVDRSLIPDLFWENERLRLS